MPPKPTPIRDRFLRHIGERTREGCLLWKGATNGRYGIIGTERGRSPLYAHRLAYEIAFGPIPDGLDVRHKCDNPICVSPEHLELGTRLDNMQDAVTRGRLPLGEKRVEAKLNDQSALDILRRVAAGEKQTVLAAEYSIAKGTVNDVVRRRTWKHIGESPR